MRLKHLFKTIHQLGFTQVSLFALYKLGLKSGYYKRIPIPDSRITNIEYLFSFPSSDALKEILGSDGIKTLLTEANHIVEGKFRIFGSELSDIKLDFNHPLSHWTDYETGKARIPNTEYRVPSLNLPPSTFDLKLIWEPARFGWAFTLGRAYHISGDEKYAKAFWRYFEIFDAGNPVNMGPQWMNGQEVAIRLMVFVWAAQIFGDSSESTNQRKARLAQSVGEHAARIPPTLLYARAQNNNHLASEAAGLYTAALALPEHPQAEKWCTLGIKWLNWCFENQIDKNGEYIQRSVNYHRLVLQLALWVSALSTKKHEVHDERTKLNASSCASWMSNKTQRNLALATRWLAELTDPVSGKVPNLGANDGAYIFPLANGKFRDFRPVVNAASRVFLNEEPFPADEISLWLEVESRKWKVEKPSNLPTLKPSKKTWAYLRVANGNLRLAHADQLHLDLWWCGENITLDPGTYLYNAQKPWNNPLATAEFHNTVTINGQDQMSRAGKFMYLDWSLGRIVEKSDSRIVAEHDSYKKSGIIHRRTVSFEENVWRVEDNLIPNTQLPNTYRLHWLLSDGEWKVESRDEEIEVRLKLQEEWMKITISQFSIPNSQFSIVRAGKLLHGKARISPTRGWYSPTYGAKTPVLSLALEVTASDKVKFISEFGSLGL